MDRRARLLLVIAVATPALLLAWLGVRAIAGERAAAQREVVQRARSAEEALAERADARVRGLEDALARTLLSASDSAMLRRDLESFGAADPLIADVFLVDRAGRFVVPRDRPRAPSAPSAYEPNELVQWREITGRADDLLARGTASDASVAVTILRSAAATFEQADLRAGLEQRLADALARQGDLPGAVAVLEGLLADHALRSAREPFGPALGPPAALLLAGLHADAGRTEAAVGVIADLVADSAAGSLRLEEVERELVLEDARSFLARVVPPRADAVLRTALDAAEFLLTVRRRVLPRRDAEGSAARVVVDPSLGPGRVALISVRAALDGAQAGFGVSRTALAQLILEEAKGAERLYGLEIALLDREGRAVAPGSPSAQTSSGSPPAPGVGRYLMETVPAWRVVARPDPAAPSPGSLGTWVRAGAVLLALLVTITASILAVRAVSRAVELARLQQEFVEGVTHELRTPLTSIRALAEVLVRAEGSLPEERVDRYHRSIVQESVRLGSLVENVLRAARIERGALVLAVEEVRPRTIVDEAVETFSRLPEGAEREVRVDDGEAPGPVRIDRAAAVHALMNLLSNAGKYSPATEAIEVSVGPLEEERPGVRLTVRDRGVGVDEAARERLFEPFFRARPDDPQRPGTGLGLRIARELARGHGGTVRYEVPGDGGPGSQFVIELPSQRNREDG